MKLYDKRKIDFDNLLFDRKAIWALLIPLIAEQVLNSLMGMADTMMVSRYSKEAMSAVSLVDSLNTLVIMAFDALAVGASIICSQYIGHKDPERAKEAAEQVTLSVTVISVALSVILLSIRRPLLRLIFGNVEQKVMADCLAYFLLTGMSYPFIALGNAGSAIFRSTGESRFPMNVAIASNALNIAGNALFIFVFKMGVTGAALSTLLSRIVYMTVIYAALRKPDNIISIRNYKIKPNWEMIKRVLGIGIPSGIENGMFQFGKLVIQSSVSTLGTLAISANAMTIILEGLNGMASGGIGLGLMTIAGQAMGAGRTEETKYYIVKLDKYSEIVMIACCALVFILTRPVCVLAKMDPRAIEMTVGMMTFVTLVKPFVWVLSFTGPNGFRAAGDVKFPMIVSSLSMWFCRVFITVTLIRVFHFGPIAVWIGMGCDWTVRAIIFTIRYFSGKWIKRVI
ncbi:MAG: MATE family efflux transporter [Catonella sp.]|nr:MATE family efflux transporter [Catonella sp.]MDY6356215.1 MATE family efflux transporter [Catonella sp.]